MIFHIVIFVGGIDNFIDAGVPLTRMAVYHLYETPYIIVQMLPPAVLIAVIIQFGIMRKNNEIVALMGSGISVWQISRPVVITALFLSFGLFLFSEVVVPYTSSKSKAIWRFEVDKIDLLQLHGRKHIWHKGADCIYWIWRFNDKTNTMDYVTLYFFDPSFKMLKRIDGRQGVWKDGKWEITEGIILEAAGPHDYSLRRFDRIDLNLPETPDTFVREERQPEEMGYWELKRFAAILKKEGYDATRYFVDLNIKASFPFVVLAMALTGIPIALRLKRGGAPLGISIGLMLCFIYLLVLGLSRSLAFADIMPPPLAAWLPNALFFFLGVYLMQHVET
jgi:lipopolysaccharide export system permease protein